MVAHIIIALTTLFFLFILFLVISKTMNGMINTLSKLERLLTMERDLKEEALEIKAVMEQRAQEAAQSKEDRD
ncbi:hypothetical protein QA601_08585 [Chitinispirillales bacterium ANBcel5]|uniref:hypothetical protein n=1 Tax=Cellulosispirillum alkaliphilum TaxID=3039283 RepID=UPI002A55FB68|nr:hypothetical protein [Chitinispirillales bacterium ANBcel5]